LNVLDRIKARRSAAELSELPPRRKSMARGESWYESQRTAFLEVDRGEDEGGEGGPAVVSSPAPPAPPSSEPCSTKLEMPEALWTSGKNGTV
jgi:hypothetical protein